MVAAGARLSAGPVPRVPRLLPWGDTPVSLRQCPPPGGPAPAPGPSCRSLLEGTQGQRGALLRATRLTGVPQSLECGCWDSRPRMVPRRVSRGFAWSQLLLREVEGVRPTRQRRGLGSLGERPLSRFGLGPPCSLHSAPPTPRTCPWVGGAQRASDRKGGRTGKARQGSGAFRLQRAERARVLYPALVLHLPGSLLQGTRV